MCVTPESRAQGRTRPGRRARSHLCVDVLVKVFDEEEGDWYGEVIRVFNAHWEPIETIKATDAGNQNNSLSGPDCEISYLNTILTRHFHPSQHPLVQRDLGAMLSIDLSYPIKTAMSVPSGIDSEVLCNWGLCRGNDRCGQCGDGQIRTGESITKQIWPAII